jgi:hypothetical protein
MPRYLMILLCLFCIGAKTSRAYHHFHQTTQMTAPRD